MQNRNFSNRSRGSHSCAYLIAFLLPVAAHANTISFEDVTERVGIDFVHGPDPDRLAERIEYLEQSVITPVTPVQEFTTTWSPQGRAGVAILDYDGDGDLDIFATNSENSANALYQNQLAQRGSLGFVDVAVSAGVADPEHAATGVCYGDTDNDGDKDLFVVSSKGHRLYRNNSDGSFSEVSSTSGDVFNSNLPGAASCAFGDINNDGLVDVTVVHGINENGYESCIVPFGLNTENELFLNKGGNEFADISDGSGIRNLGGVPEGAQGLTWTAIFFDYDQDGDVDLINADDQCAVAFTSFGGVDKGFVQLWNNDGQGNFTNVTEAAGLLKAGQWMGLSIGDLNHDGHFDFFATNMGDYGIEATSGNFQPVGSHASRWFLSNGDGTFADPGVGDVIADPFGWGAVTEDVDNDGDSDIVYVGGLENAANIVSDNPSVVLVNDGDANFSPAANYPMGLRDLRRNPQGLAAGDLNGDGFVDLVNASPFSIPDDVPFMPPVFTPGSIYDATAYIFHIMDRLPGGLLSWGGKLPTDGDLVVDLNRGNRKFKSIKISLMGTIGVTDGGTVNRDGYGAIVRFTPQGGPTAMKTVTGGDSHQSQSSHDLHFGLGVQNKGTIDVQWPGGVRNRMIKARKGTHVTFPEIPCDPAAGMTADDFRECVTGSLRTLKTAGVINKKEARSLEKGMRNLYRELHIGG